MSVQSILSIQNVLNAILTLFNPSNKPFAVFCNHSVFFKNFSGLSIIFAIKDVVLGLFSTLISQIFFNISSVDDSQNSKFSSSDTSKIFHSIGAYGEKPSFPNLLLFKYASNFNGLVKTADFLGLLKTQLCTDK
jgi:hypothetical protein